MNAITVCVGYDDLLAIALPRNAPHFDRVLVVTTFEDVATRRVAASVRNADCYTTDAFFRDGAVFNKGLALESGFDALGRRGWIAILDADVILPPNWRFTAAWLPGTLYSPRRRMLLDPADFRDDLDWSTVPLFPDCEFAGYCQIFHADDPAIRDRRPWYGVDWRHAGGCDSDFQRHWPRERKVRPGFEVLHLGPDGTNWCGRVSPRLDTGRPPDEAQQRAERLNHFLTGREVRGHRYRHEKLE